MELCSFLIVDSWTHAFWCLEKLYPILDAYLKHIQPSGEPYLNLPSFHRPNTGTMCLKGHSSFLSRQILHVPENVKICGVHILRSLSHFSNYVMSLLVRIILHRIPWPWIRHFLILNMVGLAETSFSEKGKSILSIPDGQIIVFSTEVEIQGNQHVLMLLVGHSEEWNYIRRSVLTSDVYISGSQ